MLDKGRNEKIDEKDITKLINALRHSIKGSNVSIPTSQFCFCFKDEMAKRIVAKKMNKALDMINDELVKKGKEKWEITKEKIEMLIQRADVHQLESCLALHAEENAIIQSSKVGGMGLKGGSIYTTAEPCTLCAKKIQHIELSKVVYTDPYPQSLSEIYMKDVVFEQFEGVKPGAYMRLFMPHHDQKEWQYLESQNLVPII